MPIVKAGDGTPLHYAVHDYTDRWRKADTIILIHGFARSGEFWFNMVPYLARFYRVICPDLRGLGKSTPLMNQVRAPAAIASRIEAGRGVKAGRGAESRTQVMNAPEMTHARAIHW